MSKWEIKGLFRLPQGQYIPYGLNFRDQLWWRFMPGATISVAWPSGEIGIDESHPTWDWTIGTCRYKVFSADPNEHYRPYLEKHVGRQKWDWDWGMVGKDGEEGRLTIKIRRKHAEYATILALKWA